MIRLIALAGFALAVTTASQAMTRAPLVQSSSLMTQVREGCGPGAIRTAAGCVARQDIRQTRRCLRWTGGICAQYQ